MNPAPSSAESEFGATGTTCVVSEPRPAASRARERQRVERATSVLTDPTSPWSRLLMGTRR